MEAMELRIEAQRVENEWVEEYQIRATAMAQRLQDEMLAQQRRFEQWFGDLDEIQQRVQFTMRSVAATASIYLLASVEEASLEAENRFSSLLEVAYVQELDRNPTFQSFEVLRPPVGTGKRVRMFSNERGSFLRLAGENVLDALPTVGFPNSGEEGTFKLRRVD